MTNQSRILVVQKFCDLCKDSFAHVVASLGAAALTTSWAAALAEVADDAVNSAVKDAAPKDGASIDSATIDNATIDNSTVDTWFVARGGLLGALGLRCEKSVAVQFAQLLQSEATDPAAEFSDLQRDAFAEFIRQVAAELATTWNRETGGDLKLVYEATTGTPHSPAQTASLQITSDKFAALTLQIFLDSALCDALNTQPPSAVQAAPAALPAVQVSEDSSSNLALLLDVELEATIRFGQREMLLREVFGLMPGAVVELNQLINEPAELLVAGRLIARGEVVVVDGNFGLRVTEVAVAGQREALTNL
jgi:flagellar motor switch protein FliN